MVAKPSNCDFRVVNVLPQGGDLEEIATLTRADGSSLTNEPTTFKTAVQVDVCRLGGDVVITEVNGQGYYVRGTVLRKTSR